MSKQLRQNLFDAVSQLDEDHDVNAVVLMCAGRTFIAGADVKEFGKPPEPPHLPAVVAKIEGSKKPWIAAMHGNALGGGLEIALGCSYRVAVPQTNFGLSEVKLGIIPGAGGTVRLPRLIGLGASVDLITSGSSIGIEKARSLRLVDEIMEDDLRENAITFAKCVAGRLLPERISVRRFRLRLLHIGHGPRRQSWRRQKGRSPRFAPCYPSAARDSQAIVEAIIFPMISEGAAILDEKIALRPADIDIVEIHGYGFPRWRGGLMHYAEATGLGMVLDRLLSLASKGFAPSPSEGMTRAAAANSFDGI